MVAVLFFFQELRRIYVDQNVSIKSCVVTFLQKMNSDKRYRQNIYDRNFIKLLFVNVFDVDQLVKDSSWDSALDQTKILFVKGTYNLFVTISLKIGKIWYILPLFLLQSYSITAFKEILNVWPVSRSI